MRYGGKETLYDVLDLPRDASTQDIVAAHTRLTQLKDDGRTPKKVGDREGRMSALRH